MYSLFSKGCSVQLVHWSSGKTHRWNSSRLYTYLRKLWKYMGIFKQSNKKYQLINTFMQIPYQCWWREKIINISSQNWLSFYFLKPESCFVPSLVEISVVVLEKKIFSEFGQCIFAILLLAPLWNGCGPSFEQTWENLNLLHPRMHCVKFDWNLPSGTSAETDENVTKLKGERQATEDQKSVQLR